MPKANMNLPDGTKIVIEGTVGEIQKIIATRYTQQPLIAQNSKNGHVRKQKPVATSSGEKKDLREIVNAIKNDSDFEKIEENILDKKSQVDRVLLPLYISHKQFGNSCELTSGEVSKILRDLNIQITQPNVAITFSRGASKYVIGNKLRKRGSKVYYRISRSGERHLASVIKGNS